MMRNCWQGKPEDRPTFRSLVQDLKDILTWQQPFTDDDLLSMVRASNVGRGYANHPIPSNTVPAQPAAIALPESVYFDPVDPNTKKQPAMSDNTSAPQAASEDQDSSSSRPKEPPPAKNEPSIKDAGDPNTKAAEPINVIDICEANGRKLDIHAAEASVHNEMSTTKKKGKGDHSRDTDSPSKPTAKLEQACDPEHCKSTDEKPVRDRTNDTASGKLSTRGDKCSENH